MRTKKLKPTDTQPQAMPAEASMPNELQMSIADLKMPTSGGIDAVDEAVLICLRMLDKIDDMLCGCRFDDVDYANDPDGMGWVDQVQVRAAMDAVENATKQVGELLNSTLRRLQPGDVGVGVSRSTPKPVAPPDKWQRLLALFADDPMIYPMLLKIGKFAGDAPPLIWFASALHGIASRTHDIDFLQKDMIDMIASAGKQNCRLNY